MARQPAPRIDPRDPALRPVKDFLEWLYKEVPGISGEIDEALEAAEDAQQSADEAEASAAAAVATADAVADALADLQAEVDGLVASQSTLYFGCQPPGTTANFTGRMFPGHESAQPITTVGAYPSIIVPYNCTIDRMYANVEANVSGGDTDPYTFTLWTTETGSWAASPLTCNVAGNSAGAVSSDLANSIDLDAGDRIAVQITTVAAVGSTGAGHMQVSFRMRPR